jgi:hypothetical protein
MIWLLTGRQFGVQTPAPSLFRSALMSTPHSGVTGPALSQRGPSPLSADAPGSQREDACRGRGAHEDGAIHCLDRGKLPG